MIYVYYLFAALLVWFSFKSFRGGIDYLRFFSEEMARPRSDWEPMVTIIAPCKGVDQNMLANFDALLRQDLPDYEVIFVIDDPADPAADIVETVQQEAGHQVKLVVAPKAAGSSQKVENLREGVLHADPRSEVFVFVDSDARPSPGWLRALIAPLSDKTIGAATGYRWFLSEKPTFASELRSAWNASIASALGPNEKSNFTWGGSTAIRRGTFERLAIRELWKGTLSDDFAMTRAVREGGLRIRFVPQALTVSIENCTFRGLMEFTNRQMKITRVYMPNLWLLSFFGSGLFCSVITASFIFVLSSPANSARFLVASATLILVSLFSLGKARLRLRAASMALSLHEKLVTRQRLPQMTLWPIAPFIFLLNCLSALLSRRVNWRGNRYEMVSPSETRLL